MAKEYIEREALETDLNHRLNFLMAENGEYDHYTSGFDEAVTRVEDFPAAADVAPVRHGRWEKAVESQLDTHTGEYWEEYYYNCLECDYASEWKSPYCPNCGAKMDLEG